MTNEVIWLALPADQSKCDGQPTQLVIGAKLATGLSNLISAFCAPLGYTTQNFGLACFLILLHRHTNQSGFSIGVTIKENSLECTTIEFSGGTRFLDVLTTLAADSGRAGDREKVVVGPESVNTIFDFAEGDREQLTPIFTSSRFLSFTLFVKRDELNVRLVCDGRSFQAARMYEFLAQFELLAKQALATPHAQILEYSLVTASGQLIIPDPTQTIEKLPYPLLSEAFLAVAKTNPTDEAISKDGQSWTYAEVAEASEDLAHHLRHIGVATGEVIAVTGGRSFGLVSSMLGVFRSGGILLTIDPKLPLQRQQAMMKQAQVKWLVIAGASSPLKNCGAHVTQVNSSNGTITGHVKSDHQVELPVLDGCGAAYIFFTSGSTGIPKGVVGTHLGLAHFLDWQRKTFSIGRGDRAAQMTALSFDMVLRDMFLALSSGATLCIPDEDDVLDPQAVLRWMAAERISVLHVVPTLLRAWLGHVPPNLALPDLRRVFLAGEPLTDVLINTFRREFGDRALVTNFYGPTETTLIKCFHSVGTPETGVQPVGRAQPGTQVLVLNALGEICGLNEIGQIAIRTPYRTLGYLNAPELTAAVFVRNPFRNDPDDLIYMTGDSGYYRTDGLLVMRGRIDNQVKIRGVRVEPGEVEAVIAHCPNVSGVAVVAHENASGDKFLAAFVTLLDPSLNSANDLPGAFVREFLRNKLPENMVPSVVVILDKLPLLPNGKINRKSLSLPDPRNDDIAVSNLPEPDEPANPQEAELLAIWQNVLGHSRVGVNDSFIELGGDSLTAISALVRMQRLGIPDRVAKGIFQGWTIRQISALRSGSAPESSEYAMTPKAKTNLLVNVLRGMLVAILVTGHWFEGLLNRLPVSLRGLNELLLPIFSVATPGFAIIFGLGLGYMYYPKYLVDPKQTIKSLHIGIWLVGAGIFVIATTGLAVAITKGELNNSTDFFNAFYSALLYYALALATTPYLFKHLSVRRDVYKTIALLIIVMYAIFQLGQLTLLNYEQQGFLQLCRLMVVAKFNYFNMSVGVLSGMAAGIYLHRWSKENRPVIDLAPRMASIGVCACVFGASLLYITSGSFSGFRDESILPAWKWVFYAGTLLLGAAAMSIIVSKYEALHPSLRKIINITGVLGQISLPVFAFHGTVLRIKALLIYAGTPDGIALILPLVGFLMLCFWMMSKLYRMYYGVTKSSVQMDDA